MNKSYWIQEYNEPGDNWVDYMDLSTATQNSAFGTLRGFQTTFPERKYRLILRTDTVVDRVIRTKAYLQKSALMWTPTDVAEAIADGFFTRRDAILNSPLFRSGRIVKREPVRQNQISKQRLIESERQSHVEPDDASKLERVFAALNTLIERHDDGMLTSAEWDEAKAAMEGLE